MPVLPGPPPPPEPKDLTFNEATEEARSNHARLQSDHTISWRFNLAGGVDFICSCPQNKPRAALTMVEHLLIERTKLLGPKT